MYVDSTGSPVCNVQCVTICVGHINFRQKPEPCAFRRSASIYPSINDHGHNEPSVSIWAVHPTLIDTRVYSDPEDFERKHIISCVDAHAHDLDWDVLYIINHYEPPPANIGQLNRRNDWLASSNEKVGLLSLLFQLAEEYEYRGCSENCCRPTTRCPNPVSEAICFRPATPISSHNGKIQKPKSNECSHPRRRNARDYVAPAFPKHRRIAPAFGRLNSTIETRLARAASPASGTRGDRAWSRVHRMPPGPDRAKERSRFFPSIAEAMADQWGAYAASALREAAE
nr:hypothetical protein [Mesorhizobium sp. RMAD-H1]